MTAARASDLQTLGDVDQRRACGSYPNYVLRRKKDAVREKKRLAGRARERLAPLYFDGER